MIVPIVSPASSQQQQGQSHITIRPGHTYRATIVAQEASTVLLRIGGVLIRGESELSLPVGQIVYLQADTSQSHNVVLRIAQNPTVAPHTSDISQVLTQLGVVSNSSTTMIASVLLNWLLPLNPELVRKLARELKRLPAEQQAAFLNVQGWARSTGSGEDAAVLRMVTRFLSGEAEAEEIPPALRQINNSGHSSVYPEVQVLWWEHSPHHGEIYVLKEKPQASPDDSINLAVRINTLHYGEAWAGFSYNSHRLSLSFHSEDEQFLAHIEEQKPLLALAVEQSGLTLLNISCHHERAISFLDVFPLAHSSYYKGVNFLV